MPLFWFGRDATETRIELEVQVDARKRRLFEVEARRQDLTIEQLLTHAVFLHIGAETVYKTARIPVRM